MPKPTTVELQAAVNAAASSNDLAEAAKKLGVNRRTLHDRVKAAEKAGLKPTRVIEKPEQAVRRLEKELKEAQRESADAAAIKAIVEGVTKAAKAQEVPKWLEDVRKHGPHGVPTLFLSDLHWGEVVHPSQIGGVNEYNTRIAHQRLDRAVQGGIHLLRILDAEMRYPGIVMPLGGDMVSGDIHEELAQSNEMHTIPTVLDMEKQLAAAIALAADTFGAVFLPCVTGNHGRNTHKIRAKDRHHTSFDWLLYKLLESRFANDKRVTFLIPDGPDAYYKVYNTRYLLTHGDKLGRGGDGIIGALGPIIRGDHKKRSRNAQIDMSYDVLLCGHFHQYTHMSRVVVNGSLKGMDEYSYGEGFGFEVPQQALWITHPKYGPTYRMPVYCDHGRDTPKTTWVSVPAAK